MAGGAATWRGRTPPMSFLFHDQAAFLLPLYILSISIALFPAIFFLFFQYKQRQYSQWRPHHSSSTLARRFPLSVLVSALTHPPSPQLERFSNTLKIRNLAVQARRGPDGRLLRPPKRLQARRLRLLLRQRGRGRRGPQGGLCRGRPPRGRVHHDQGVGVVQHARRRVSGQELEGSGRGLRRHVSHCKSLAYCPPPCAVLMTRWSSTGLCC